MDDKFPLRVAVDLLGRAPCNAQKILMRPFRVVARSPLAQRRSQRGAHQAVGGSSDFADGVHFLVDHIRRHVPALEEIAVEPPQSQSISSTFWISSMRSIAAAWLSQKSFVASLP
jgi:hypothetical protein